MNAFTTTYLYTETNNTAKVMYNHFIGYVTVLSNNEHFHFTDKVTIIQQDRSKSDHLSLSPLNHPLFNILYSQSRWLDGYCIRLSCGRLRVRVPVGSNGRP